VTYTGGSRRKAGAGLRVLFPKAFPLPPGESGYRMSDGPAEETNEGLALAPRRKCSTVAESMRGGVCSWVRLWRRRVGVWRTFFHSFGGDPRMPGEGTRFRSKHRNEFASSIGFAVAYWKPSDRKQNTHLPTATARLRRLRSPPYESNPTRSPQLKICQMSAAKAPKGRANLFMLRSLSIPSKKLQYS